MRSTRCFDSVEVVCVATLIKISNYVITITNTVFILQISLHLTIMPQLRKRLIVCKFRFNKEEIEPVEAEQAEQDKVFFRKV